MFDKKVAVIILNYNGTEDTINCIQSIEKYDKISELLIFVLDNNSVNDKKEALKKGLVKSKYFLREGTLEEAYKKQDWECGIWLINSELNLGFSKGNNVCIQLALNKGADYCILLNNDTELIDSSISKLICAMEMYKEYGAMTTTISYWASPQKLWNAGGKLFLGTRKYYSNKNVARWEKKHKEIVTVDFITGCFLGLRKDYIQQYGCLSEKFFFGEEDYEFSLRYKKNYIKMGVLLNTKILHKVGQSLVTECEQKNISKRFIHQLNRSIDMKDYYSPMLWRVWREFLFIYDFIKMKNMSLNEKIIYLENLRIFSEKYNSVSYELFQWILMHDMRMKYKSES